MFSQGHQKLQNQRSLKVRMQPPTKSQICLGAPEINVSAVRRLCIPLKSGSLLQVTVDGNAYHKICFKCTHGGCVISPSNYIAHEGKLYCRHHHTQLFKEKGNYSQLEGDNEKEPAKETVNTVEVAAES
uniref:LIM zinc-binding domain-containing protein n=1 Tax=Nelumbo nucifera TaxID=4432 RepID=A0A822Z573_NELNU|nr:TPA_asm: hypothetical protein HUJ06_015847 [Nelumbo nucifera]